jgi:hypothetical protein
VAVTTSYTTGRTSSEIWVEYDTVDRAQFEADCRQLEDFRRNDFRKAMTGELANIFEKFDDIHLRHLALVSYYCEVKARQYVRSPLREFEAGSDAQVQKLEELYRRSRIDARLLEAQQRCWACNSVVLTIDPGVRPMTVDVTPWSPADVIVHGDPLMTDIRQADRVEIRTPVKRTTDPHNHQIWYGTRVYTPEQAYIEARGGEKVGIFREDLSNPFGYVPLVAVRLVSPQAGIFFPHPPGDALSLQIGTIVAVSDMEFHVRMKSSPREVVTGPSAEKVVAKVEVNPDSLVGLGGRDLTYSAVNLDPRIDRYIEAIGFTQRQWSIFRHLNPDGGLWASTGITGVAKEIERDAEVQDTFRQEEIWREAERDLVEVIADVSRAGPSALAVSSPSVEVDYRYLQARQNDLQEAQSVALLSALGLESASRWVAERDRITLEEARERVEQNLDEQARILEMRRASEGMEPPPGLDAIAAQVMT